MILRQMNVRGRVVIPKEVLESRGIMLGDSIVIKLKENYLIVQKYEKDCYLCKSENALTSFKEKNICAKCINEVKKIIS